MPADAAPGPYVIRHGDLKYVTRENPQGRHVCDGSQEVAVAYDSVDGTLLRHGALPGVQQYADKARRMFTEAGFEEIAAAIVVLAFPVSDETVAELNACVATTGRVLGLPEAMERIAVQRPDLVARPRYPSA